MKTQGPSVVLPAALLFLAAAGGCTQGPAGPTTSNDPSASAPALRLESANFRMYGDRVADTLLRDLADRLEAELPRVMADLAVSSVRPVRVKVWGDQGAWSDEVRRYFGRTLDATGYVTGPEEVRVLAVAQVARNVVHELCHSVSLYVNPSFANNPRWLWESVALYENRELVDPRFVPYMAQGRPPTLAQLDVDVTAGHQVYEVGYLIGEFVVARGGLPALRELVRTHGDTATVLGLSPAEFETAWYAYVRERYLS